MSQYDLYISLNTSKINWAVCLQNLFFYKGILTTDNSQRDQVLIIFFTHTDLMAVNPKKISSQNIHKQTNILNLLEVCYFYRLILL